MEGRPRTAPSAGQVPEYPQPESSRDSHRQEFQSNLVYAKRVLASRRRLLRRARSPLPPFARRSQTNETLTSLRLHATARLPPATCSACLKSFPGERATPRSPLKRLRGEWLELETTSAEPWRASPRGADPSPVEDDRPRKHRISRRSGWIEAGRSLKQIKE